MKSMNCAILHWNQVTHQCRLQGLLLLKFVDHRFVDWIRNVLNFEPVQPTLSLQACRGSSISNFSLIDWTHASPTRMASQIYWNHSHHPTQNNFSFLLAHWFFLATGYYFLFCSQRKQKKNFFDSGSLTDFRKSVRSCNHHHYCLGLGIQGQNHRLWWWLRAVSLATAQLPLVVRHSLFIVVGGEVMFLHDKQLFNYLKSSYYLPKF